jgi:xanthosine utilization system XapX-like protein
VGNLLSVAVVYTLTNMLIPEYAFPVLAIMQVLWVVIILGFGMVVEPKMLSEREQRKSNKKSAIGKVYSQLK